MKTANRVEFSVRWSRGQRAYMTFLLVVPIGLTVTVISCALVYERVADVWVWFSMALFLLLPALVLLEVFRFTIWLDGDRLVKRGALWRRSVSLRTATFRLVESSWQYNRRLSPLNVVRIEVTAPTLVVRSSTLRRIKLPLAQRAGHDIVDGQIVVAWLPEAQLIPLADAVDRYATAENKDRLVRYLRHVGRSAVQPRAAFGDTL